MAAAKFLPHLDADAAVNKLHCFPGLSSNKAVDVTQFSHVVVNGCRYETHRYMWVSSTIGERYIGGFLPYILIEGANKPEVGDLIYSEDGEPISCITRSKGDAFCVSGIGYETLDLQSNVRVHHRTIVDKHSVYGGQQGPYCVIKQYALEKAARSSGSVTDYYVWIGDNITHIVGTCANGKEVSRVRIKHGGIFS
ncbi:schlafen protein [Pteropox virus]|uniref:Schlafen protein n=1 Tax=Pteropox virus TaxID=1873698 RepID=A0A1B1MR91_9POXV|nr:schlafen protein [Pteropox virus]ANS71087.1 schlafen protein [Pteropox virus]